MEPDTVLLNITGSFNTWDTCSVCHPDGTCAAPKLVKGARELDMARKPAI